MTSSGSSTPIVGGGEQRFTASPCSEATSSSTVNTMTACHTPSSVSGARLIRVLGGACTSTSRSVGFEIVTAQHPSAVVSASARVGAGATLAAGSVIGPDATLGDDVIVNTGAIVDHDCVVGDHVHIAIGARLASGAVLEDGVHVGAGATVLQGLRIGAGSVVGAGAVVTRDVDPDVVVAGVPATVLRPVSAR